MDQHAKRRTIEKYRRSLEGIIKKYSAIDDAQDSVLVMTSSGSTLIEGAKAWPEVRYFGTPDAPDPESTRMYEPAHTEFEDLYYHTACDCTFDELVRFMRGFSE